MDKTTKYDHFTDQQIVERLIHYDRDVEAWFFSVYCRHILQSVNQRFFNGEQQMEKLTNDFYLHLKKLDWHALRQYRPTGSLQAWLTTVATNLFMPRSTVSSSFVMAMDNDELDEFIEDDNLLSTQKHEKLQAIEEAMDNLQNPRYRQLLEGIYRRHLSLQLMAEEMEISISNLYNLHHRALAALKANIHLKMEDI